MKLGPGYQAIMWSEAESGWLIYTNRHLGSQLVELEKLIDKMMQQEFARFTAADLNRPIDEDCSIDEVNFLNQPFDSIQFLISHVKKYMKFLSWCVI